MAVNSARQDELQKEVPKRDTLIRMFRYLLDYKRTIAFVSVLILIALAATLAGPLRSSGPLMYMWQIRIFRGWRAWLCLR